ncbi:MAG: hypothetical protein A2075_04075 [Geobacteraceae bacterium GWC2_58_44]|nr:MAG: hypothetical protein A2075_04075 [Geobacteraceae bacterium GWC2_58_44]
MTEKPISRRRNTISRLVYLAAVSVAVIATLGQLSIPTAEAGQVNLSWSAPTNSNGSQVSDLAGYRLHTGNVPGSYQQSVDVGKQTSYTLGSLSDGASYYFAVTAYNTAGLESQYSNEIKKTALASTATYSITASSGTGGTITAVNNAYTSQSTNGTLTISSATVTAGSSQTFSIAAGAGYRISDVSVDGVSVGPVTSYSFGSVTANHTIAASFALTTATSFTITASAGAGGSITPSGTATINSGASKTYTITAATGYRISGVTVDGVSVGTAASYTFSNIAANHTIVASFALTTATSFTITASAGTGGSITPSGTATVDYGASKTYTITAATGYLISNVKVDGISMGSIASYSFSSIRASHTIQASFLVSGTVAFATNCGGGQYTDSKGVVYRADARYSGGSTSSTTPAITGTSDDPLYQKDRYGNFYYAIPVANGNYSVTLKFAETYWWIPGKRVFSTLINGQTVISNLDIFSKVGQNAAYDVVVPVRVINGVIKISFTSTIDWPKISAIMVRRM